MQSSRSVLSLFQSARFGASGADSTMKQTQTPILPPVPADPTLQLRVVTPELAHEHADVNSIATTAKPLTTRGMVIVFVLFGMLATDLVPILVWQKVCV
jgi:hypothetical protein